MYHRPSVPRWRLARDGPFTNERSHASLRVLGKGCAFRHTTYSVEDHAPPEGGLGVPLNHPRFLEWISAPTSAWLLEMSPGQWCDTLSRDQAMTVAMQLHKDACLMNTNLDILDQYALALHGTASKILQQTIGGNPYPKAEVAAAAQGEQAERRFTWRHWVFGGPRWTRCSSTRPIVRSASRTSSTNKWIFGDISVFCKVLMILDYSVGPDPRAVASVLTSVVFM